MLFLIAEYFRNALSLKDFAGIVLGGSYLTRPFSAFWFVTALIVASLLFRFFERFPAWVGVSITGVGLLAAYMIPEVVSGIPYAAGVAIPALLFIYAGKACQQVRLSGARLVVAAFVLIGVGLLFAISGLSAPLDMKASNFGTPVVSIAVAVCICAGLTLFGLWMEQFISAVFGRLIGELAIGGFMVVLTHAAVLYALGTQPNQIIPDFYLALTIPWAAAVFLHRTRLSGWALGLPQRLKVPPQSVTPER
ncbi:hypothetical protein AUR04nite_35200 [Glutamicibacter uratoxydans]|uniref:Acyltransferase 3 domain-containing protein n=2 Tax=Glutamicibacter uratoxydans TaxID=43667 RepID=A0A4Y4DX82_GLUUR|nr:hypothetical protein AUR04nite_35200 [Glutamicibacter uratoxydans]